MFGQRLGSGDEGYTDLMGPGRVPKYDLRPETYGTLDEASSALGLARALSSLEMPRQFVLPGASAPSAAIDVARTIVRRAERHAVRVVHEGEMPPGNVLRYLNRLSSLLFVLARYEEHASGVGFDIASRKG